MEALHEELPFDLDFHPSSPFVVTSLITGELCLFRYRPESQPERLFSVKAHKESCRAVRFVDSGKGDDEGCIKVWDTRERSCCNSFEVHDDYISDMTYVADSNQILATSGDGTLSVNNPWRNKVRSRSEFSEDELLSLVVMKNGKKVVCGTPSGALLLYSWGYFKDCSVRFLGHTQSVDTMLKLDEETLVSGSSDGVIRLVGILPNRIIQPLAEHSEYPIEALAFSNDKKYLGSISHDKMLKLWDLEELLNGPRVVNGDEPAEAGSDDSDDDSDDDAMDVDMAATSSKAVSFLSGGAQGQGVKKAGV
ncbi:unnamed protein product [Miscanthus lutarioriparius]|uniref:WD repeat-containing protein 55 n=1 Tax=Miscanthus lutarioriparius TaxID=422564 RepID=A0A811SKA2_9POAL|nr:unnamed protein product [Miscanthus lutarioriparius]